MVKRYFLVADVRFHRRRRLRQEQQGRPELRRLGILCLADDRIEIADRAIEAHQGLDALVLRRREDVAQPTPAEPGRGHARHVGLRQRPGKIDQEADVVRLQFRMHQVLPDPAAVQADAGRGDHDIAVARQVFGDVRILERRIVDAGCVDHHRELARFRHRVAHRPHAPAPFKRDLLLALALGDHLQPGVDRARLLPWRGVEIGFPAHQLQVVVVAHAAAAFFRRIPDHGLHGTTLGLPLRERTGQHAALRRELPRAIDLLEVADADAVRAGRVREREQAPGLCRRGRAQQEPKQDRAHGSACLSRPVHGPAP